MNIIVKQFEKNENELNPLKRFNYLVYLVDSNKMALRTSVAKGEAEKDKEVNHFKEKYNISDVEYMNITEYKNQ